MPGKKKDESQEIEDTEEAVGAPSKDELIARIAELEAAKAEGAEQDGSPAVKCECYSSIEFKDGDTVTRWGHDFVVQEGGRHMVGMIPSYDVANGTGAGRWKPVAMSESDAQDAYWRMQYRNVFGGPPRAEMKPAQMRVLIEEKLDPGKSPDGRRIDHVKA